MLPDRSSCRRAPTSLSRRDQLRLKEYDSLNFWNDNESKVNLAIDALPVSVIGGIAYIVSKFKPNPSLAPIVFGCVASTLVLIIWLALSAKYSARLKKRFEWMQEIERDLGFSAHIRMTGFIKARFLQRYLTHLRVRIAIVVYVVGSMAIAYLVDTGASINIIVLVGCCVFVAPFIDIVIGKGCSCFEKLYKFHLCGKK